jgi:hypothetical protein
MAPFRLFATRLLLPLPDGERVGVRGYRARNLNIQHPSPARGACHRATSGRTRWLARRGEEESRSRGAPLRPSYGTPLSEIVTTGHSRSQNGVLRTPMPVVHAELPRANAGGSAVPARLLHGYPGQARARRTGKNERKKIRRRNADRRNEYSAVPYGHDSASRRTGAHLSGR